MSYNYVAFHPATIDDPWSMQMFDGLQDLSAKTCDPAVQPLFVTESKVHFDKTKHVSDHCEVL